MSQITKQALAASLKKLLAQKRLDKITVSDITEDCGLNRQTFYYHFQDIYDLAQWMFLNESSQALGGQKTYDTWQQGFLRIFKYVLANKAVVENTFYSYGREHLESFLYSETYTLLIGVINEKAEDIPVNDADKTFIADFYKYAFVGLMIDWIKNGMEENPDKIIERLGMLIEGDIAKALEKMSSATHGRIVHTAR